MSKQAFTPGPWFAEVAINNHGGWKSPEQQVVIHNEAGVMVAYYATGFEDYPSDSENEANARLIAAVPELYEALSEAVKWADEMDTGDVIDGDPIASWRAALAKAVHP